MQSAQPAESEHRTWPWSSQPVKSIMRDYTVGILTRVVNIIADALGDLRLSESIMVDGAIDYNSLYDTT